MLYARKQWLRLGVLSALLIVAVCAIPLPSVAAESQGAKGANVTLLTVTEECEYCSRHQQALRAVAKEAGVNLKVRINNYDPAEQANQVQQAIAERPDAIILWPADARAIVPSLRKIQRADIPLIITNSMPEKQFEKYWDAYTGPDDHKIGYRAGKAMVRGFKQKGIGESGRVFVIIGVPGTTPQIRRLEGFKDALSEFAPGIEIVDTQAGNWDQTQATNAAAALFTQYGDQIDGVYAEADNMAAGVVVAARRAGIDPAGLVIVGSDCSIGGVRGIEAGDQYASVLSSPILDGQYAAQAVVAMLNGEQVPRERFTDHPIITKENVTECYAAVGREQE